MSNEIKAAIYVALGFLVFFTIVLGGALISPWFFITPLLLIVLGYLGAALYMAWQIVLEVIEDRQRKNDSV